MHTGGMPVDSMIDQLGMLVEAAEECNSPVPVARYINSLYMQVCTLALVARYTACCQGFIAG